MQPETNNGSYVAQTGKDSIDITDFKNSMFYTIDDNKIGITGTSVVVESIMLAPPKENNDKKLFSRTDHPDQRMIEMEAQVRSTAYKNTFKEKFDTSFFDDTDMHGPYCLHVVYDKETNTPLVSARTFSCNEDLIGEIGGTDGYLMAMTAINQKVKKVEAATVLFPGEKKNFMVDRMSNIVTGNNYRNVPKSLFFGLIYRSVFITYKEYNYVYALSRIEASHILLAKYIPLGLKIIGYTSYKVGRKKRKHWVLVGNIAEIRKHLELNCKMLLDIYR